MSKHKPNVLILFTDDQRFDTIRTLGNSLITTPSMDKLVENGVTFTHAHIMGGTSGAVCMPSRAMLHTGKTLFHLPKAGEFIPADYELMGETFQKAGYETCGIGKWHNGRESYARSFTMGAEIFFGGMNDHWNVPAYDFDPTGKYETKLPYCPDAFHSNEVKQKECDHITTGKHSSELFSDAAIKFLENRNSDKPFLFYVAFMAPHDPRTMPKKYLDMYNPDEIPLPENFMGGHPFDNGNIAGRDEELEKWPRTPKAIRRHLAEYFAMITHLDAQIGRIIEVLRKTGNSDNTIIVFAGDNGLALGQHGLMGKQNLYEHSVRVPLVFSGPGIPKGVKSATYCYLLDIFRTLCDLTGIQVPPTVEGKSLVPAMKDNSVTIRETLYLGFKGLQRSVKDDKYKLIEYVVDGERTTQLFDLADDPYELNNLAGKPEHKHVLDKLRSKLERLRDENDDNQPDFGAKFWEGYSE